jgi:hypothetical protein
MSKARRMRTPFEESGARLPMIKSFALTISAGSFMPGATSERTKLIDVPGWMPTNS